MPYIKSEDYVRAAGVPETPGELNYAITMKIVARLRGVLTYQEFDASLRMLVTAYLDRVSMSYTNGNAVMGVLDCAARELRRRIGGVYNPSFRGSDLSKIERQLEMERNWVYNTLLAPYEDVKIMENGDVYPAKFLPDGS